jgi:hypothetical protein
MPRQRGWWSGRPPITAPLNADHPAAQNLTGFWAFGEGGGSPRNHLRPATAPLTVSGPTWVRNNRGTALRTAALNNYIVLGTIAQLFPSATQMTLLLRSRRHTVYDSQGEGAEPSTFVQQNNTVNERILGFLPHHGGNGTFFDWGGDVGGTSRLYLSGQLIANYGDDVLILTVGPRGMELWRNGRLVGNQSGAAARVQTNDGQEFRLGAGGGTNAAATDFSLAITWARQLSVGEIASLWDDPEVLFRPGRVLRSPAVQTAVPASDVDAGTWTTDTGATTDLYAAIDEAA